MTTMMKTGRMAKLIAGVAAAAAMLGVAGASTMAEPQAVVGGEAPNFTLKDLNGEQHSLKDFIDDGKIVVLEWYNPQCPFVAKHYSGDKGPKTMLNLEKEFAANDVVWLRINSGAPGKQGAGQELNEKYAKEFGITGPILIDESGKVGKMYGAKRTPEMYIIGTDGKIHYHGAIDDNPRASRKDNETNYVRTALQQIIAGETVTTRQTDAYGCPVKYDG